MDHNLIWTCISLTVFPYSMAQYTYSPNPPTPYKLKKVSGTQTNSIIGIICTIIAGLAILGVVVCVIHTRRRSKHIREASFERYQTKMLEVPDVSSSNPQPSANCWKQISYTPQTHSSRGKQIFKISFQLRARTANRWRFSVKNTKAQQGKISVFILWGQHITVV